MSRKLSGLVLVMALVGAAASQSYHAAEYITGGAWATVSQPSNFLNGVILLKGNGSVTTVARPPQYAVSYCMDVDNRHFVALITWDFVSAAAPGQAGLYRFDPATLAQTTICGPDTINFYRPGHLHVNADGDYVFNGMIRNPTGLDYRVMKVDHRGALTTLLTTSQIGRKAAPFGYIGRNIDNGNLLICDETIVPGILQWPVLELAPDGTVRSFNDGSSYGWNPCSKHHCEQNVLNGHVEGPYHDRLYRLTPGSAPRGVIATLRAGTQTAARVYNGKFDLQTAPAQRWVSTPFTPVNSMIIDQWLAYVAMDGTVTSMRYTSLTRSVSNYDFDFYRGRHIQTLKTGPHKWTILLSCPRSPGRPYMLAASLSGVRPGVALPDGRRINLRVDDVTRLTLGNMVPAVFNPGPLVLNASGEARGILDFTSLNPPPGGFGVPFWIALAVLDTTAPGGIRYLPDTYVMRI